MFDELMHGTSLEHFEADVFTRGILTIEVAPYMQPQNRSVTGTGRIKVEKHEYS
jgi:hypothetical protein